MLSVRSLHKINTKGTTKVASKAKKLLRKHEFDIVVDNVESSTSPIKSSIERRVRIGAVEAVDRTADEGAPCCVCPTHEQMIQAVEDAFARVLESIANLRDMLLEFFDNGGGHLLLGLLMCYATFEFMKFLWSYLQTELDVNLELPSMPSIANAFFEFAEAYPLLALTANFAFFIAIGTTFFFINEITETLREWSMTLRRFVANPCEVCSMGGYQQLDDTAALAGMLATALPPIDVAAAAAEANAARGDQRGGGRRGDLEAGISTGPPGRGTQVSARESGAYILRDPLPAQVQVLAHEVVQLRAWVPTQIHVCTHTRDRMLHVGMQVPRPHRHTHRVHRPRS
jgi:hypothetical protein